MTGIGLYRSDSNGEDKPSISVRALVLYASFIALASVLTGCGPKWKAPVENRTMRVHSAPSARPAYYTVGKGDTVAAIAWRWRLDWRSLAAWNGIRSPYTIYPGQRLRLSPPRVPHSRTPKTASRSRPASATAPAAAADGAASRAESKPKPSTVTQRSTKPEPTSLEKYPRHLVWRWPVSGRILANYHPADDSRKGIKIGGESGRAVTAAESGKVVYSGSGLIGYGRLIIIKHNNEFLSAYGHNRKLLVKEGDWVAKGDKIAEMGLANNGQAMLHFEIRRRGKPVDPVALLPRQAG